MLCGHGSRNRCAVDEFARLAETLARRLAGMPVDYGYLEFANPVIQHGLDRLRARGRPSRPRRARHAVRRRPRQERHSLGAQYLCGAPSASTSPMGASSGSISSMLRAAGDRIAEAEAAAAPRHVRATIRCCWWSGAAPPTPTPIPTSPRSCACSGRAWASAGARSAYSGVTFPLVAPALDQAARLGFPPHHRLSLFPVHRRAGQAHLRRRPTRRRRSIPGSSSSRRPISTTTAGHRHLRRPPRGDDGRREPHELRPVQISRAGARLRGRGRAARRKATTTTSRASAAASRTARAAAIATAPAATRRSAGARPAVHAARRPRSRP